jgi:hypothetical protein
MFYGWLANLVVALHVAFILFGMLGGLFVLWRKRWVWVHVPVVLWAVLIEWIGWVCPLTPLENWLRYQAGEAGYHGSFVEQYVLPLIYPTGLTRAVQFVLGAIVLGLNVVIYGWVIARGRRNENDQSRINDRK